MMTVQKATKFLNVDEDELLDALELALFEIKKYFLTKPLLAATAKPRLNKLAVLLEIETLLSIPNNKESHTEVEFDPTQTELSPDVLKLWEQYMQSKQLWKTQLSNAASVQEVIVLVERGLIMEKAFSLLFPEFDWIDEVPVFGQEPDAMEIQKALRIVRESHGTTFEELHNNKNKLPANLLLALKRLSLLPKYL